MQPEIKTYRLMSVLAALAIFLSGFLSPLRDETAKDPMYLRYILSATCLVFFAASHTNQYFRSRISEFALIIYVLIISHSFLVVYLNNLQIEYILTLMLAILIISLAISRTFYLFCFSVFNILLSFLIVTQLENAPVNRWYFLFIISCLSVFSFVILRGRLQLEKKIEEIRNEVDKFIYRSSHDLKGPVASILGLVCQTKNYKQSKEMKRCLDYIDSCAKRLHIILTSLNEIKSTEVHQEKLSVIDFNKVIAETMDYFKHDVELFSSFKFKIEISHPYEYIANNKFLMVIFHHLLDNALKNKKADFKNSEIGIFISGDIDYIKIQFSDNGRGIPEKHRDLIFDMFYKGDGNSNSTGLGLYIVRSLVEKLKGEISLNCTDSKTLFIIKLPIIYKKQSESNPKFLVDAA